MPQDRPTELVFRLTLPSRSVALNVRDRVLSALAPLGFRIAQLTSQTDIRLIVAHSRLSELPTTAEAACGEVPAEPMS
jgi:hypothetical protein